MENKLKFGDRSQQPSAPEFVAPPPYFVDSQPLLEQPDVQGVITVQNNNLPLGNKSQRITCPHCRAQISTRVEAEANSKTHIIAILLCSIGFPCCACCFPYCMDSCRSQKHYCPSCNSYLGEYNN